MQFFGKNYKAVLKPVEDFLMKFNSRDAAKRDEPAGEKDKRLTDAEVKARQHAEEAGVLAIFADLVSRGEGTITHATDDRPAA